MESWNDWNELYRHSQIGDKRFQIILMIWKRFRDTPKWFITTIPGDGAKNDQNPRKVYLRWK